MDIDLDLAGTFDALKTFPRTCTKASMVKDGKLTPHPCGVYFQEIPVDPLTKLAAIPYDAAEQLGYFKLDFLHLFIYDHVKSKAELRELARTEPDWALLGIPSVVAQLFQLSKHFEVVDAVKPTSVIELADCMALIRPQKRFMLKAYVNNREAIRNELYKQNTEQYSFKKGHACSYALAAIVQLHLIKRGVIF